MSLLLALLLGCAENACEDWAEVAYACAEGVGADTRAYEADAACPIWSPEAEAVYGEWYRCQAESWSSAACTSDAAVEEALAEASAACPAP
ncbi:MAG: hypothetical protein Q8P41_00500 [Pseudomonadota bacterium]|nr:hypothetical protein [Pseudomonadota bacterium]